jgi:hypothetical protein
MKNQAAVKLGRKSAKARRKKYGASFSEHMKKISHARFDKKVKA